jgi:alpha-1,6-mannosyltransferase
MAVALSGLAATPGGLLAAVIVLRFMALAGVALLAWQVPRLALLCGLSTASAARVGVVTPLILIHGLSAAHNDVLVAALITTALALAAGLHPAASRTASDADRDDHGTVVGMQSAGAWGVAVLVGGVVAGAVGVKVTAIVVVPFVFLLLGRRWVGAAVGAVGGFVAVSVAAGLDLGWVQALRGTGELAQWSSVPTAVGMTVGYLLRPFGVEAAGPIAVARVAGVITLAALGIGLVVWAWRRRAGTQKIVLASGLALAGTAILGPVFYPWYAIAPLAVLAASATEKRRWLAVATVICTFLTLPNGLGVPVLTKAVGAFAVTAALMVLVARTRRLVRAA